MNKVTYILAKFDSLDIDIERKNLFIEESIVKLNPENDPQKALYYCTKVFGSYVG